MTGMAVTDACQKLRTQIQELGAEMLEKKPEEVDFDGKVVYELDGDRKVTLEEIAVKGTCGNNVNLQASATRSSKISPPPFMVGMAEVEIDKETGGLELLDYVAVVDCGTPLILILPEYRPRAAFHRESGWLCMRISSIMKKDNLETIPLCNIRFQPDRMWVKFVWNLHQAMKNLIHLEQNL